MEYTTITEEDMKKYQAKIADKVGFKPNWARIKQLSKKDPTIFAKYYLGITPFHYQDQVLNDNSNRIMVCSSRQIGKTYVVAIKALHYAMFHKDKQVLVFSKNANQAKKFLREMKRLMFLGTQHVNHLIASESSPFSLDDEPAPTFPEDIDEKKPNNTEEFTLTNGSTIRSLPSTDSSRGYTADLVIIDEAAFVPDEIFDLVIEPTVRFTGGAIILLSTPNGQKGFFHHFFDPEDKKLEHEYTRYWWDWQICPNENIREVTLRKKNDLDPLRFAQEYEAKFTTDADAFFQNSKVKEACDENLSMLYEDKEHEMVAGIDVGVTKSRTVITLCYYDEERDDIILAYQKEYPPNYDNNNLRGQIKELEGRFKIVNWVIDYCPQGIDLIKWMQAEGKPVKEVYFGKEKVKMYFLFKGALNKRYDDDGPRIRYPFIAELQNQMLTLQQKDSKRGSFLIEKPSGGRDDCIDSFVLATLPFLDKEPKKEFRSFLA